MCLAIPAPAENFGGPSTLKAQVRKFYEVLWNGRCQEAIPSVLQEDFTFRGSVGDRKRGHQGFAEYVQMVHCALSDYRCVIEELVEEGSKVFAKMTFGDFHSGPFMGFEPTGGRVRWQGCALFPFRGKRVCDLWVLGDLKGLEDQLRRNSG